MSRLATVVILLSVLAVVAGALLMYPAPSQATFPGANGRILFNSDRDGNRELYTMNADGSDQTNLTGSPAYESRGAWSRNGSKIVFQKNEGGYDEIFVMDSDGGNVVQLTSFAGGPVVQQDCCPSWSPDGTQILFSRWHSDDSQDDIFVMNANGSGQTNLTHSPEEESNARWSPDGMRIVFQRELASGHNVVVMDADGSNLVNLTNDDGNNQDPDWSPDGGSIVYVSAIDGDFEIYSMNPDGSGRTDLTDNESSDFSPTWSPDGEKIAFVSNRDGNFEVYVMNADGSDQTRLTNNPAKDGDFSVDWQPLIIWGDNNCSGSADPVDSLLTLRFDAGLGTNTGGCPDMGEIVEVQDASLHPWGDVDCSADVTPVDSLKLLRFDAGLIVAQEAGCPGVGTGIKMVEG